MGRKSAPMPVSPPVQSGGKRSRRMRRCSAQMLSYSGPEGVFAGVSLEGLLLVLMTTQIKICMAEVTATEIISGQAGPPPASAKELLAGTHCEVAQELVKGKNLRLYSLADLHSRILASRPECRTLQSGLEASTRFPTNRVRCRLASCNECSFVLQLAKCRATTRLRSPWEPPPRSTDARRVAALGAS